VSGDLIVRSQRSIILGREACHPHHRAFRLAVGLRLKYAVRLDGAIDQLDAQLLTALSPQRCLVALAGLALASRRKERGFASRARDELLAIAH